MDERKNIIDVIKTLGQFIKEYTERRDNEYQELLASHERLRAAAQSLITACDTAPPIDLINHIGKACDQAREALAQIPEGE